MSKETRRRLYQLKTDADFDAFCVDEFPDIQRRFAASADRQQRINLLFQLAGAEEVSRKLDEWQVQQNAGVAKANNKSTLPRDYEPPLRIPDTNPSTSWLAFSSRATHLVGRDSERSQLSAFLDCDQKFSWWLIIGSAGSGKSRLALELCRQSDPEWRAGFLGRTEKNFNLSQFSPSQKTLIVIDYVASRAAEVSEAILTLSRRASTFVQPVRVLLLERNKGSWWSTFSREESQSESAEIIACRYADPLAISGLPGAAVRQLAEEVVRARGGAWNAAIGYKFLSQLLRYDPRGRPLYAMIVAEYLDTAESNTDLLRNVLKKEAARRRQLIPSSENLQRMENLLLLATAVSGLLPQANGFDFLAACEVAELLPDANLIDEALYNDIAGASRGNAVLSGFQPDILGERFLLDRLCADGIAGLNALRVLRAGWMFQPQDVRVVAVRSTADFPEDKGLSKLCDLPLDSSKARMIWAEMISDMIAVTRTGEEAFAQHQLQKLTALADSHPQEKELQEATARADYNMGCKLLFSKNGNYLERFVAAIDRVGIDSPIGIMAFLNQSIRYEGEEAIQAWTKVIQYQKASDETRACALNNRANVYANSGQHESAIQDRTELLALKDTSHDRRFVALFGRSESYLALGNHHAALDDLSRILETSDITPQDKLRAQTKRAAIMHQLGRRDDARSNLQAAIDTHLLPSGRSAQLEVLIKNAEQSRRMSDYDKADHYLSKAFEELKAHQEMDIRILIVSTLLVEDTGGDIDEVNKMWEYLNDAIRASTPRLRIADPSMDWLSTQNEK